MDWRAWMYRSSAPTLAEGEHINPICDASGNLKVNVAAGTVTSTPGGASTVGAVRQLVTTAGTRVQLASHACRRVIVQALPNNSNEVAVGDVTVVAAISTRVGIGLQPGFTMEFLIANTNLLYVDAITSGEGITYFYEN